MEQAGIHTVVNSFDVMGGSHSFTVAWTSAKFRDKNPVLYKALIAALKEATDIVNKDKKAASALWIEDSKSKLPLDMVDQDRRRAAGALDDDAGKHDKVCRLHGERRHAEGEGGVVEGLFLPEFTT